MNRRQLLKTSLLGLGAFFIPKQLLAKKEDIVAHNSEKVLLSDSLISVNPHGKLSGWANVMFTTPLKYPKAYDSWNIQFIDRQPWAINLGQGGATRILLTNFADINMKNVVVNITTKGEKPMFTSAIINGSYIDVYTYNLKSELEDCDYYITIYESVK